MCKNVAIISYEGKLLIVIVVTLCLWCGGCVIKGRHGARYHETMINSNVFGMLWNL